MRIRVGRRAWTAVASLRGLALLVLALAPVPFWGARESSPVGTDPAKLKPGQFIWDAAAAPEGPIVIVVSVPDQIARVYRNGIEVGVAKVSTGKPGHPTPTGVFTILNKDKDHRSKTYNDAPMPYSERLTWDGVALHAGGIPGYPESHGCVHLPTKFANLLFEATNMGMTVVVAEEGASPVRVVHPTAIIPIEPMSGAEVELRRLQEGEQFRWTPDKAPNGPISIVVSRSDESLLVYRNGIEIGHARIGVRKDPPVTGTHAYIVAEGFMDSEVPGFPGMRMPKWIAIGIPGRGDEANRELDEQMVARFIIPPEFAATLMPLLKPGVVVLATDAHLVPDEAPRNLQIINSDPPAKS